jgi:uncharacterized membrane protein
MRVELFKWELMIAVLFGIIQIPWCMFWMFHLLDKLSLAPVRLVADSALYMVYFIFTVPAIFAAVAVTSHSKSRRVLVICGAVLTVSFLILWLVAVQWHADVYSNLNGTHPFE